MAALDSMNVPLEDCCTCGASPNQSCTHMRWTHGAAPSEFVYTSGSDDDQSSTEEYPQVLIDVVSSQKAVYCNEVPAITVADLRRSAQNRKMVRQQRVLGVPMLQRPTVKRVSKIGVVNTTLFPPPSVRQPSIPTTTYNLPTLVLPQSTFMHNNVPETGRSRHDCPPGACNHNDSQNARMKVYSAMAKAQRAINGLRAITPHKLCDVICGPHNCRGNCKYWLSLRNH